jgi:uncharacterized protein (TIGR02594 family)
MRAGEGGNTTRSNFMKAKQTMTQRAIPRRYSWLADITAPRHLVEAIRLHGIEEHTGRANNPTILAWADEIGVDDVFLGDSTPWCGLFAALCVKRAGWELVRNPLWALNWTRFGRSADEPALGDVLVFRRPGGGHVGFYVGEDDLSFHVLGGNQSDSVSITCILRDRLAACRRAPWRFAQPRAVRSIRLTALGAISANET